MYSSSLWERRLKTGGSFNLKLGSENFMISSYSP
jgi:hypothetical protein